MCCILESSTHLRVGGATVARSHLGFLANLREKIQQNTEKIMQSHMSICNGFKKEIFYNKTNLITQKIYFISKLSLKN